MRIAILIGGIACATLLALAQEAAVDTPSEYEFIAPPPAGNRNGQSIRKGLIIPRCASVHRTCAD